MPEQLLPCGCLWRYNPGRGIWLPNGEPECLVHGKGAEKAVDRGATSNRGSIQSTSEKALDQDTPDSPAAVKPCARTAGGLCTDHNCWAWSSRVSGVCVEGEVVMLAANATRAAHEFAIMKEIAYDLAHPNPERIDKEFERRLAMGGGPG